ncbi:MAG: hypothetical protein ACK4SF_16170 [Algoriphagus aquaeductus]|uniref:hypothetical protein n=1 Tax=Algoriphagus aquaeductus TaxID=475299 RepID=UPI00391C6FFC
MKNLILLISFLIIIFNSKKEENKYTIRYSEIKDTSYNSLENKLVTINKILQNSKTKSTRDIKLKNPTLYKSCDLNSKINLSLDSNEVVNITGITEFNIEKFLLIKKENDFFWIEYNKIKPNEIANLLIEFYEDFFYLNTLQNKYTIEENKKLEQILIPNYKELIKELENTILKDSLNKAELIIGNNRNKKISNKNQIILKEKLQDLNLNFIKIKDSINTINKQKVFELNQNVKKRIEEEKRIELEKIKAENIKRFEEKEARENKIKDSLNIVNQIKEKAIQKRNLELRNEQDKKRLSNLTQQYGSDEAKRIIEKKVWIGMTEEMLLESLGKPQDVTVTETIYGKSKW